MIRQCLSTLACCKRESESFYGNRSFSWREETAQRPTGSTAAISPITIWKKKRKGFQQVLINKVLPSLSPSLREAPGVKSELLQPEHGTCQLQPNCSALNILCSALCKESRQSYEAQLTITLCTHKFVREDSRFPQSNYTSVFCYSSPNHSQLSILTCGQKTLIILSHFARHNPRTTAKSTCGTSDHHCRSHHLQG